jgi:hypothetical protein
MANSLEYTPDSFCPKCGDKLFEVAAIHIKNIPNYLPYALRCANDECKAVLGTLPESEVNAHGKKA